MPFLTPVDNLDYQIIFQIVATFEGFSIWKGARAFKTDVFTVIDGPMPIFDDGNFQAACEELKNSNWKLSQVIVVIKLLFDHWMRSKGLKLQRILLAFFWNAVRVFHKALVFVLRSTPIFTIPLLSLSYLLQWGCKGTVFHFTGLVFWFIVAKMICYALCWCLATMLLCHIRVDVPTSDETSIIPSDG